MKIRFLCAFAAIALLGACSDDKVVPPADNGGSQKVVEQPQAPMQASVVPGSQKDFEANVGDRVFFELNKSNLSADAKAQLAKWADFLKKYQSDALTVEGHCDERGTEEYNLALGDRRANAVKDFLVANGVSAARLKTISYGKLRPAVAELNEAAWAKNCRAVGVVTQ